MGDTYDLVNEDYGIAKQDKGFYCNMIKTKPSSFRSIFSHWNDYRTRKIMENLNSKLVQKRVELVDSDFKFNHNQDLTRNSEARMNRLVTGIAKLESRIKVLSRENVPKDYVKSRAIKLKKKMMDNLWYHTKKTYSVGVENYDNVFESGLEGPSVSEDVSYASSSEEFNRNDFQNVIDEEFRNAMNREDESKNEDVNVITPEVVAQTVGVGVDNNSDSIDMPKGENNFEQSTEKDEYTVVLPFETDTKDVGLPFKTDTNDVDLPFKTDMIDVDLPFETDTKDVDLPFSNVSKDSSENSIEVEDSINIDEVRNTINSALEDASIKYRNPSSRANLDSFDDYGRRKEDYQYAPMTDEEIELARVNIEKDLYDEKYHNGDYETQNIRDEVALVPENRPTTSLTEKKVSTSQDKVVSSTSVVSGFDESVDFESLKASLLDLNSGIESSIRSRDEAEQDAELASQKAKEARKMFEESEERKTEKLQELYYYKLALMKQKEEIEKQARLAREEADRNRNFIAVQESRMQDNEKISNEIDMLIPDELKPKGR